MGRPNDLVECQKFSPLPVLQRGDCLFVLTSHGWCGHQRHSKGADCYNVSAPAHRVHVSWSPTDGALMVSDTTAVLPKIIGYR